MTRTDTPKKGRTIPRTLVISEKNSNMLDRAAHALGVTYSAALNLFLAGELDLKRFAE